MISRNEIKRQATILKEFLSQNNATISLSSCLQAVAKMHGFKDWNTMSATLKKKQPQHHLPKGNFMNGGKPIHISETAFLIMSNHGHDGKFGEDAYRLLSVVLRSLKDDSLVVKDITQHSLWEKWTPERFNNALNQLISEKFIHRTYDDKGNLVITINPLFFWKGSSEKHFEAIKFLITTIESKWINSFIESPEDYASASVVHKSL